MIKNKTLCLSILSVFALVLVLGLGSAVSLNGISLVSSPSSVSNDAGSFNIVFTLTNEGIAGNLYYNLSNFTSSQSGLSFSFDDSYIATDAIETITATISFTNGQTGTITGNINVGNTVDVTDETLAFSVPLTVSTANTPEEILTCKLTATEAGEVNDDLRIKIDDIKVTGFGKDEEWLPVDEISVDIKVENKNRDEKISNIAVGWGLYNADTDEWYIDDEESDFNLKKKDSKTLTITFKLDDNIDELADGTYTLYVWANGEIDTTSENNVPICTSASQDIDMQIESDFVILDNIKFTSPIECGMDLHISADIWNIGEDDQEGVYVLIQNTALGISEKVDIGDINAFDKEKLDLIVKIPQDADERIYKLDFDVYTEDDEIYENDYDSDKSSTTLSLDVKGGCAVESNVLVSATLESGGKAGQELVIKASVTNLGEKSATYTLRATGYSGWASLVGIEPTTLVIEKGESKEVLLTFNVEKTASGDQLFNIEVLEGTDVAVTRPVSVSIIESGIGFSLGDNWYLWLIGLLNVILVIIIIMIAVRVAKS